MTIRSSAPSGSRAAVHLALLALCTPWVSACIDGFGSPSAYEEQAYLCGEAGALEAEVDRCQSQAETCAGVLSMRGRLDGTDILLSTHFTDATFRIDNEGAVTQVERIDATGATPYFNLSFKTKSLAAEVGGGLMATRTYGFHAGATSLPDEETDDLAEVAFRISTLSESVDLIGITDMGTLEFDSVEEHSVAGSFEGSFDVEDDVAEGCFVILATSIRTR